MHWHLGSEHYSVGEFDENGKGLHGNHPRPSWANCNLADADAEVQNGFRCHHYDKNDENFTKPYLAALNSLFEHGAHATVEALVK